MRTADGLLPVGESEFARDATFGYRSSSLPEWVEEKTGGRVPADEVLRPNRLLDTTSEHRALNGQITHGLRAGRRRCSMDRSSRTIHAPPVCRDRGVVPRTSGGKACHS
ncbi:four-carbon acid sugar kinase family protein [Streptomyces sp. B21-083]|uniref:four-carbon acid sugar kinase family protein n=1 Tax=Streptomyces sp. B21-083 TaxID=3039410 RepID=UPI003FA7B55A